MRMKLAPLIDEQGRLLGWWNIVDFGAVVVMITTAYGLFLATRILSGELRRPPTATTATVAPVVVRAKVILRELDRQHIKNIHVGDSERDAGDGSEVATIVELGEPQPDFIEVAFGQVAVDADRPSVSRLPVVMRLIGEARGGTYFFQGRLIGPGSTITFRPPPYRVIGTVVTAFPISGDTLKQEGLSDLRRYLETIETRRTELESLR